MKVKILCLTMKPKQVWHCLSGKAIFIGFVHHCMTVSGGGYSELFFDRVCPGVCSARFETPTYYTSCIKLIGISGGLYRGDVSETLGTCLI